MDFLEKIFNYDIDQRSPIQKDVWRKVDYDENGNEIISWPEVDYEKLLHSLGTIDDWKLENLLKAGISPNFSIHTGYNTRLEGVSDINNIEKNLDEIFNNPEYAPGNETTDKE